MTGDLRCAERAGIISRTVPSSSGISRFANSGAKETRSGPVIWIPIDGCAEVILVAAKQIRTVKATIRRRSFLGDLKEVKCIFIKVQSLKDKLILLSVNFLR